MNSKSIDETNSLTRADALVKMEPSPQSPIPTKPASPPSSSRTIQQTPSFLQKSEFPLENPVVANTADLSASSLVLSNTAFGHLVIGSGNKTLNKGPASNPSPFSRPNSIWSVVSQDADTTPKVTMKPIGYEVKSRTVTEAGQPNYRGNGKPIIGKAKPNSTESGILRYIVHSNRSTEKIIPHANYNWGRYNNYNNNNNNNNNYIHNSYDTYNRNKNFNSNYNNNNNHNSYHNKNNNNNNNNHYNSSKSYNNSNYNAGRKYTKIFNNNMHHESNDNNHYQNSNNNTYYWNNVKGPPHHMTQEYQDAAQSYAIYGEAFFKMPKGRCYDRFQLSPLPAFAEQTLMPSSAPNSDQLFNRQLHMNREAVAATATSLSATTSQVATATLPTTATAIATTSANKLTHAQMIKDSTFYKVNFPPLPEPKRGP